MKAGEREPMTPGQALSLALLLVDYEQELCSKKANGWYRQLCEVKTVLTELKESNTMSTDVNFFKGSRTKATTPAQPQAPGKPQELPESARAMLEKLAAEFNRLRETLALIESRLVKLESGKVEEKAVKKNGHVRSFQEDITSHITSHSKRVQK